MSTVTSPARHRADLGEMDADSRAYMALQPPPPATPPSAEAAREGMRKARPFNQPDLPHVACVREYQVPGKAGTIPVRYYRGVSTLTGETLPVQVYFHGGGWVIGDLDSHDWVCRAVANAANCAVVSVDYRLAPEHIFPAAYDDALAATQWVAAHAKLLNIDPARMSVGGDSAGGNLAAAVALALRDNGKIKLRAQILTYPIVDLTFDYDERFEKGVALTGGGMRDFIEKYVPDANQRRDLRCSPLFAKSLKGLPPALVILAGFDPLYDEGEAYAARLKDEGVTVKVARYPGQMHGFVSRPKLLPKSLDAIAEIASFMQAHQ
ncbi:MAG: alpha/beta hydrolase [Proteobacteria bacterium]|nr:alpha/beta hydrolase [Pseudomonadota bacterium]